jgi:hypothetical protein
VYYFLVAISVNMFNYLTLIVLKVQLLRFYNVRFVHCYSYCTICFKSLACPPQPDSYISVTAEMKRYINISAKLNPDFVKSFRTTIRVRELKLADASRTIYLAIITAS